MQTRFGSLNKLECLSLIDPTKYSVYSQQFLTHLLENLSNSNYKDMFDFIRLKNELILLCTYIWRVFNM